MDVEFGNEYQYIRVLLILVDLANAGVERDAKFRVRVARENISQHKISHVRVATAVNVSNEIYAPYPPPQQLFGGWGTWLLACCG